MGDRQVEAGVMAAREAWQGKSEACLVDPGSEEDMYGVMGAGHKRADHKAFSICWACLHGSQQPADCFPLSPG